MSTGFIWIAAILILGAAIATVGDRVGTKVGKARLSLFKMRPRRTATVVTVFTGAIISASTLGILLSVNKQLRTGLFEVGKIQRQLERKREDLETTQRQLEATNKQKSQVEQELTKARAEQKTQQIQAEKQQAAGRKRLAKINQSLQQVLSKQIKTQAQLNRTNNQLSQVTSEYQQAQTRLATVSQQASKLRAEIKQRQKDRQKLLAQLNEVKTQIVERDREIAKRKLVIAKQEARRQQLEKQKEYLEQATLLLGRYLQELRQGNFALFRGQVLAARVVRVVQPSAARQAVDEILREANRNAIELTQPGVDRVTEQVVQPSNEQVKQLIEQIDDGRDYFVRILAANNYLVGEKSVQIMSQVAVNQKIFPAGYVLAAITSNPRSMTAEEMRRRVDLLLGAANFRAQQAGIMGDTVQIADNRIQTLIRFFEQLQQYNQPLEMKAIAAQDTYTSGPLRVDLVAVDNGQVVFSTRSIAGQPIAVPKPLPSPNRPPSVSPTPGRGISGQGDKGTRGQGENNQ